MYEESKAFVVRRPRHEVKPSVPCRVWLERVSREPVVSCDAELVDLSRNGLQIHAADRFDNDEPVVIHIQQDSTGIDLALSSRVRWQRSGEISAVAVGCVFDQPLGYEEMGELFLSGILSS